MCVDQLIAKYAGNMELLYRGVCLEYRIPCKLPPLDASAVVKESKAIGGKAEYSWKEVTNECVSPKAVGGTAEYTWKKLRNESSEAPWPKPGIDILVLPTPGHPLAVICRSPDDCELFSGE